MTIATKNGKRNHKIQIENVGPIERLTIPLPEAGVVVLHGRNGSGKSHALAAVDSLVSGRGKLPCRDGAARGLVAGCGARLTIGRSSRRQGEAEVTTLEGKLDISQLVQPPIKDEDAADRTRIKALIQLSGAAADPAMFKAVLPADTSLGELVTPEDMAGDPVALAGKVKRALEAEARRHEKAAESTELKAASIRERAGDVDPAAIEPHRAEVALQEALVAEGNLKTTAQQVAARRQNARKAAEALKVARAKTDIGDPAEIEAELVKADEMVVKLDKALAVARERQQGLRKSLGEARRHQSDVAMLEKALQNVPEPITEEAIAEAGRAVAEARSQHAAAMEASHARRLLEQVEEVLATAGQARPPRGSCPPAPGSVDLVLSDIVARVTKRLRVEAGRLVCDTDRGAELLSDLSGGERWRLALEIAAEQVGQGGLVTVPQEAWEGLDPQNRTEVAEIARRVGVVLLTAECANNAEIAAEVV